MKASHFSSDMQEFLLAVAKYEVKYVIVGGEAVIYHGHARLTGDVDIFYESLPENVNNVYSALMEFWEGDIPGLNNPDVLLDPGVILQFGVPPNRIDLINKIENVSFKEAWKGKIIEELIIKGQTIKVYFLGLDELIKNKEALERSKDREDLKYLKKAREKKERQKDLNRWHSK